MVPPPFVIALAPRTKESHETIQCLTEWMDTCHCTPKILCADMAFQSTELHDLFRRFEITPFLTGPCTPWPNRAEAAVRVSKATLVDLGAQLEPLSELKQVTRRELLRTTSAVRISMVTYGGQALVELVF